MRSKFWLQTARLESFCVLSSADQMVLSSTKGRIQPRHRRFSLVERYFAHILQGGDLVPSVSHCENISRLGLMLWKLRLNLTFYATPNENKQRTGLVGSVWRAISGLFAESHDSKLQTVFRTAMVGAWDELRLWPTRGWLSRKDEREMFRDWDAIFRRIRAELRSRNVISIAPVDTATLYEQNVKRTLKPAHETARTLDVPDLLDEEPVDGSAAEMPPCELESVVV